MNLCVQGRRERAHTHTHTHPRHHIMDQEGYEFEAPSFCDFEAGGADGEGDSWFGAKKML